MSDRIASRGGPRVVIAGGGIMGLSIGCALAEAGAQVTIFERDESARGASWAAAGMLIPHVESETMSQPLARLCDESFALWPEFAARIQARVGWTIDYQGGGTLLVARNNVEVETLRQRFRHSPSRVGDLQWLDREGARQRAPQLAEDISGAFHNPAEARVDNRLVCLALARDFAMLGGRLVTETAVSAIRTAAGRCVGVDTTAGPVDGDRVVVAAGAWTNAIHGLDGLAPRVRPVKGQILALDASAISGLLNAIIFVADTYLVPRADGRLIVAATVEEAGFDGTLTAGAIEGLLATARSVVPAAAQCPIAELWVGFRPTTDNREPVIGETALPGLFLATGHFRYGILLAPATARYLAEAILGGEVPDSLARFAPPRTAAAS